MIANEADWQRMRNHMMANTHPQPWGPPVDQHSDPDQAEFWKAVGASSDASRSLWLIPAAALAFFVVCALGAMKLMGVI